MDREYKLHTSSNIGGKANFKKRIAGLITAAEWQEIRNSGPLVLYGHAGGKTEQGGNKKISLDMQNKRLLFHPKPGICIPLDLTLKTGTPFYNALKELEFYCSKKASRDLPVTYSFNLKTNLVSIIFPNVSKIAPFQRQKQTIKEILLTESVDVIPDNVTSLLPQEEQQQITGLATPLPEEIEFSDSFTPIVGRVLAYDANPYRKGFSILQRLADGSVKELDSFILDNTSLKPPGKLASNHADSIDAQNKQLHEEREQAKLITNTIIHYRCENFAYEGLNIANKEHNKGKTFNRATNNHWKRKEFLEPLIKRLKQTNCKPTEVDPSYSSKIGNANGRSYGIPDPACAALEIGRRFLQDGPAIQRFIYTFRLIFVAVFLNHIKTLFTSSAKRCSRKNSRNRQKEASIAYLLPPERLSREYYKMRCEKLKPKKASCTRRYLLRDLCSNLPLGMAIRLSSVASSRSKVLRIQPTRVDDLIIQPVAVPRLHPQ